MTKAAKCVTCHESPEGKGLNLYGQRLAILPIALSWSDRLATLESEKPRDTSKDRVLPPGMTADRKAGPDQDVDGDGVPNWVEILAGSNPSDSNDLPKKGRTARISEVISCRICHTATGLPGEGLEANPHNELGILLAKTFPKKQPRRPNTSEAIRLAAERTPILNRLGLIKTKRPKKSRATYWEKLRLLHSPAAPADTPEKDELKAFRKFIKAQTRPKNRDDARDFEHERHKPDGFLLDAKGLD